MDADLQKRLDDQDKKMEAIFKSTEATRKYFKWTLIISIVVIVLPLVGLLFAVPQLFSYYQSLGNLGL